MSAKTLIGKTALVTGASSGIGFETAFLLRKLGMKVYAAARRIEKMKELENFGISIIHLDLTDDSSCLNCINTILSKEKSIDVLINNAGYGSYGAVENVPLEEARRQFEVNLFGLARITQLVLPSMRENGFGKIVNVASMAGRFTAPFGTWYHATKYALEAYSDGLRNEVRPFGIHVILIEPGMIQTQWGIISANNLRKQSENTAYKDRAAKTAEWFEKHYGGKSLTSPEKVAKTIVKAVCSRKPGIRYQTGKMSKTFIFIKKILCDRLFDWAVCLSLGIKY